MLELMLHLLWKIRPTELPCDRKELQGAVVSIFHLTHAKFEGTFACEK